MNLTPQEIAQMAEDCVKNFLPRTTAYHTLLKIGINHTLIQNASDDRTYYTNVIQYLLSRDELGNWLLELTAEKIVFAKGWFKKIQFERKENTSNQQKYNSLSTQDLTGLTQSSALLEPKNDTERTLQNILSENFGTKPEFLIPNIPFRRGRYPGAVLAYSKKGQEFAVVMVERPDNVPDISGTIENVSIADRKIPYYLSNGLLDRGRDKESDITLKLEDVRIFEKTGAELKALLANDTSVTAARASDNSLLVVTRSFEAIPQIEIKADSLSSTEARNKTKDALIENGGNLSPKGFVVFRSQTPQIVAYEVAEVSFISSDFGESQFEVVLKPPIGLSTEFLPDSLHPLVGSHNEVAYAVLASPRYSHQIFGDLPAANTSANVMRDVLKNAGCVEIPLSVSIGERLNSENFKIALSEIEMFQKKHKPKAVIIYYVGHGVSGAAGSQYLVLGDYKGKLSDDIGNDKLYIETPQMPTFGTNFKDLSRVMNAIEQNFSKPKPGLVSVSEIYNRFKTLGISFALLIDTCYQTELLEQLRAILKFTSWGDYYGVSDFSDNELQEYFKSLEKYGNIPYLCDTNPVILSAKPGSLAPVLPHPFEEGFQKVRLAPLAVKSLRTINWAQAIGENLTWKDYFRRITDFNRTGELSFTGSISWSDFDVFENFKFI